MALFRRHDDQDRWDRSQRRFRQPEYEGRDFEDARRARPGERGLGWARRRDIDDRMSQQAAPRGGGRYDRTGEDRYAEGLEDFERHEGYRGRSSGGWELDEGGVRFGRAGRWDGEPYRHDRGYGYGEYGRGGGYGTGFGQGEYERGGWFGASGQRMERFRGVGPRGYQRSDERIRDDVCDLLTDDDEIDASQLTIDVSAGVVVISGTVDSRETKRRAEDVAESVTGVREVQNNLRVQSQLGQRGTRESSATSSQTTDVSGPSAAGGEKSRR